MRNKQMQKNVKVPVYITARRKYAVVAMDLLGCEITEEQRTSIAGAARLYDATYPYSSYPKSNAPLDNSYWSVQVKREDADDLADKLTEIMSDKKTNQHTI